MKSPVLWLTGLPCSGKTTLAKLLTDELTFRGHLVARLDDDELRKTINADLGFSREDRHENVRRVAHLAKHLSEQGSIVIAALISPYHNSRAMAKSILRDRYCEIYVDSPLKACMARDIKGHYLKARSGKLRRMTGVSSVYEVPIHPDIHLDTFHESANKCLRSILDHCHHEGWLYPARPIFNSLYLQKIDVFAEKYHRGQFRRGGQVPYITHPRAVAALLQSHGYDPSVIAAGLLHDVLEDTGCEMENLIRHAGDKVARMVCFVTDRDKTQSWRLRKKDYLTHLKKAPKEALAVACADKIHNMQSLIELYRKDRSLPSRLFQTKFSEKIENYRDVYRHILKKYPNCPLLEPYAIYLHQLTLLRK